MSNGEANGRTHEPSIRELTKELDALERLMEEKVKRLDEVAQERDLRYEERFKAATMAVDTALIAAREQVRLAFDSSEKAIVKAEIAQEKAATRSDERVENNQKAIAAEIQSLRDSRSKTEGHSSGLSAAMTTALAIGGLVLTVLGYALAHLPK